MYRFGDANDSGDPIDPNAYLAPPDVARGARRGNDTRKKKRKLDDNGVILQIDSWTENYAKLLRDCTTDLQLSTKTIYAHGAPTRVLSLIIN